MMGLGCGGDGAGGNSSSSTSNLSASAPPFTIDRSNPNRNSNPLVHYPESCYGTEPFSHNWKYTNSISHKPELDILSTRTTSFPLSDDYRLSDAISTSPSPTHCMAFSRDAKTLGNTLAYGGGVKSYYPPFVHPMVDKSSPLVEDGSAYTHSVIDQDYRPEWMHRLKYNQLPVGSCLKELIMEVSLLGGKKLGSCQLRLIILIVQFDGDYMTEQIDSLDINGIQYKRVELDGSYSSRMENIVDTSSRFSYTQNSYDWEYRPQQMDSLSINGNLYKRAELDGNLRSERAEIVAHTFIQILSMTDVELNLETNLEKYIEDLIGLLTGQLEF
ncbi:uncharacterized protein LOC142540356 [Primulina tabacum]|uniref:uncharacterized protein LOC142540356 n=1 Tax=Primulina tabacum TaxID=48773 RepID=UPI003F5A2286